MFCLSLPSVVCRRAHVLFTLFVFIWFVFTFSCLYEGSCLIYVICVYLRIVVANTYCVVFLFCLYFVLCLVYAMLPVSLDCPFLITPSVFSDIYLQQAEAMQTLSLVMWFDRYCCRMYTVIVWCTELSLSICLSKTGEKIQIVFNPVLCVAPSKLN